MKKILLIATLVLFVAPLFVFADWCGDAGGTFCSDGIHMNCYCSDGSILAGSSCDSQGSFTCHSVNLNNPGETTNNNTTTNTTTTTTGNTADSVLTGGGTGVISNPIKAESFTALVDMIIEWILDIAMVLAPLIIVYGGFTIITAAGEPAKVNTGKQIILYAAIGFLLALLASSLVDILKGLAGGA